MKRPLTAKDRLPKPGDVVKWYGGEYFGSDYNPPPHSAASIVRVCCYIEGVKGPRSLFPGDLPYVVYKSRADGGSVEVDDDTRAD